MKTNKRIINRFFKAYEKSFQDSLAGKPIDPKKIASSFSSSFIQASPKGIMADQNDKKFLDTIPKIYQYYNAVGTQSMKIGEQQITPIDDLHSMVRIHWLSKYLRKDGKEVSINFDVHYFVQLIDDQPKIFGFVAGDEEALMKENGLTP